jgi:16S rRNA processing protein RimM
VRVVVGRVVGAHGVAGQVRVRVFGDGPDHLLHATHVLLARPDWGADDPAARTFEIEGGGTGRRGEIRLKLAGVGDREAAATLRGRLVLAEAEALPRLPPGEFYGFELVGCRVETLEGHPVGRVREIWEAAGHDVLVVEGDDGRTRLLPTARELMPEVDPAARRIRVVDLPGLLDPAEAPAGEPRRGRKATRPGR